MTNEVGVFSKSCRYILEVLLVRGHNDPVEIVGKCDQSARSKILKYILGRPVCLSHRHLNITGYNLQIIWVPGVKSSPIIDGVQDDLRFSAEPRGLKILSMHSGNGLKFQSRTRFEQ